MTFTVYASLVQEVKKRLDRIGMKAARYSIPFSYVISKEHPQLVRVYEIDPLTLTQEVIEWHTVAAVDFEITCEQLIQANGWSIRAMVEHGEKGNIVTVLDDKPADSAWFTVPAHCDHCKTNHFRKVTYFVEHEDEKIQQVGQACLCDYTGINPATVALWTKVQDILKNGMDRSVSAWQDCVYEEIYPITTILAHAYDALLKYGYCRSNMPGNTREEVIKRVLGQNKPSAEALEYAKEISDWLVNLDLTDSSVSDYIRNCQTLVLSEYAAIKDFGRLVYLPMAYQQHQESLAATLVSRHVGEIGQRLTIHAETAQFLSCWENAYGRTYLYKFIDEEGNVFIWYASREIDIRDDMVLKATVKNHNERNGIKQTIVTRGKVL